MAFKTFVQVGRAVIITKGPETGKLGVIGTPSPLRPTLPQFKNFLLTYPSLVEIISEKSVSSHLANLSLNWC
jgi:hypothetical protein